MSRSSWLKAHGWGSGQAWGHQRVVRGGRWGMNPERIRTTDQRITSNGVRVQIMDQKLTSYVVDNQIMGQNFMSNWLHIHIMNLELTSINASGST